MEDVGDWACWDDCQASRDDFRHHPASTARRLRLDLGDQAARAYYHRLDVLLRRGGHRRRDDLDRDQDGLPRPGDREFHRRLGPGDPGLDRDGRLHQGDLLRRDGRVYRHHLGLDEPARDRRRVSKAEGQENRHHRPASRLGALRDPGPGVRLDLAERQDPPLDLGEHRDRVSDEHLHPARGD